MARRPSGPTFWWASRRGVLHTRGVCFGSWEANRHRPAAAGLRLASAFRAAVARTATSRFRTALDGSGIGDHRMAAAGYGKSRPSERKAEK